MDYNDEEYLKLFEQINKQPKEQMLRETPDYNNMPNLNETPNTRQYNINENVNDGWGNLDIQIETRVNGVQQQSNNPYQQPRRRQPMNDPNGLAQYMDDDNLNEVYRQPQVVPQPVQPIQEVVQTPELPSLNENFNTVDVVSVELFERMNQYFFVSMIKTNEFNQLINNKNAI
jgi:hypothetical protein